MTIDKTLLDNLLEQAAASPRLRMNYDLRTHSTSSGQALPEDSSQRMLNALLPGTVLPVHRHTKTTETLVLLRGRMEEIFYEEGTESVRDGDSHCKDLCRRRVLRESSRVLLKEKRNRRHQAIISLIREDADISQVKMASRLDV